VIVLTRDEGYPDFIRMGMIADGVREQVRDEIKFGS
jgi:hypothetical protein